MERTPSSALPGAWWQGAQAHSEAKHFLALAHGAAPFRRGEQEAWVLSYLDLVTLLLVLFVVLLAFSHLGQRPVEPAVNQLSVQSGQRTVPTSPNRPAVAKLVSEITVPEFGESVRVAVSARSVNVEIDDSVLFVPGSAELNQRGESVLERLAQALSRNRFAVSVEGHTDDVPIKNARFASNWELSSHRATTVTRYLVLRGIAPARLRAIGYADTRPKATNDTPQGRARNRRVSLVVHLDAKRGKGSQASRHGATRAASPPPG